jgi:hypothetical protein
MFCIGTAAVLLAIYILTAAVLLVSHVMVCILDNYGALCLCCCAMAGCGAAARV